LTVDSNISIRLSSQRDPPGQNTLGQSLARLPSDTSTWLPPWDPQPPLPTIDPVQLDGQQFFVESFFDVFFDVAPGCFPADSFFDVFVEIDPPSTNLSAVRNLVQNPQATFTDSFFDVFFDITVTDGGEGQNAPVPDTVRFTLSGGVFAGYANSGDIQGNIQFIETK